MTLCRFDVICEGSRAPRVIDEDGGGQVCVGGRVHAEAEDVDAIEGTDEDAVLVLVVTAEVAVCAVINDEFPVAVSAGLVRWEGREANQALRTLCKCKTSLDKFTTIEIPSFLDIQWWFAYVALLPRLCEPC